jgi:hypothetical protein
MGTCVTTSGASRTGYSTPSPPKAGITREVGNALKTNGKRPVVPEGIKDLLVVFVRPQHTTQKDG